MKCYTICALVALVTMGFVSCGGEDEYIAPAVINYETYLNVCFENKTERALIIEHNLAGVEVSETVEPLCKLDILSDYVRYQYSTNGYTIIVSGTTKYTLDFKEWYASWFGINCVNDYPEESYVRVYDADHVLIKEWNKAKYDPTIKNPFKHNYYTYTRDEQTTDTNTSTEHINRYEWRFYICEWLLGS